MDIKKSEPLKTELENFLDSILEGKQSAVNGQEAKAILKIALESNHNNYFSSFPTEIDNFISKVFRHYTDRKS